MSTPNIKVYTWTVCPYCVRAKNLLKSKGVEFEEINLDGNDTEFEALKKKTGLKTVPQIFIEDQLVGGYTDLSALEQKGELNKLLGL